MLWLQQLKQASFRGVPFHVDTVEVQAGDNVVVREYPFEDLPQVFRMGTGTELFKFHAYVIGPDYQAQRNALRLVLTGDGVLVHPSAGTLRASVADKYTMSEAPLREGGIVRFQLTFVRSELRTYPQAVPNTQAQAVEAAGNAKEAAVDQFGAEFTLKGAPAWVQSRVVDRLGGVLDGTWGQLRQLTGTSTEFTDSLVGSYQVLRGGLTDLVSTPAGLAGAVRELFTLPTDLADGAATSFQSAYQSVFGIGSTVHRSDFEAVLPATVDRPAMMGLGKADALGVDTAARRTLGQLNGAVDRLTDTMALAAWVESVAVDEIGSYDQVTQQRAMLHERCTAMLMQASSSVAPGALPQSSWHDAVLFLMTAGLGDLQARGRDLARLTSYTPRVCMSIWEISHLVYGTARWADEIMTMNPHITHPLLVPAGRQLRMVLHD